MPVVGVVHKGRRQLRGEGSKIDLPTDRSKKLPTCGREVSKYVKNVDVFYGWSLAVAAALIGCGFTEDAPAFSAQINSSFFHTIMTIEF